MNHRLNGWRRDCPDHRDLTTSRIGSWARALRVPSMVDLSTGRMARVEDQGELGSCGATAGTSAVEYLAMKQHRAVLELSRLFLYYATRVWVEGVPPAEDSGVQIRDVMKALARYGVCREDLLPYDASRFAATPDEAITAAALQHRITSYRRCRTLNAIRVSIAQGWPVVGGFSCPESIESLSTTETGVVEYPRPDERIIGGHAVLFVGFDDHSRTLKFENSWGPQWGIRGYGFLSYDYVASGLADDFWSIRA